MKYALRSALLVTALALALVRTAGGQDGEASYVVAYIEVSPTSVQQAMELIAAEVEASRNDSGNVLYEALQRIGRPNHFVLLETWADAETQQSHRDSARTTAFREALDALLYSPYDERLHVQLDMGAQVGGDSPDAVYALTHVDVTPDNVEPTLEQLHPIAGDSRAEPGNRRFDVVVQSDRSNHFTVIEKWQSAQAQTEHVDAPHSREFRDNLYPLSGALYDERLYRALN